MNYPIEYKLADEKSNEQQKDYITSVKSMIILQLIATFFSQYWGEVDDYYYALCFMNVGSIIFLCFYVFGKNYNRWISSRAVAEAVKSLSWKFAMKVSPFNGLDSDDEKLLKEKINEVLQEKNGYKECIKDALEPNDKYIPQEMMECRKKNFSDRFLEYNKNRVADQKEWYKNSAEENKKKDGIFKGILIVLMIIMFAFTVIHNSLFPLATVVSMIFNLLLWMQIKKYSELNKLYAYTTHSLSKEYKGCVSSSNELAEYVQCMEDEFMKEHSQWLKYKN